MTHIGNKRFSCSLCDKTFKQQAGLKAHQNIHTNIKKNICFNCNKTFTDLSTLKKHESTHTGERPFGCLHCEKKFTRAAHLRRYQSVHTFERPFSCSQCDKAFSQKEHLQFHIKSRGKNQSVVHFVTINAWGLTIWSDIKEPTLVKNLSVAPNVTTNALNPAV